MRARWQGLRLLALAASRTAHAGTASTPAPRALPPLLAAAARPTARTAFSDQSAYGARPPAPQEEQDEDDHHQQQQQQQQHERASSTTSPEEQGPWIAADDAAGAAAAHATRRALLDAALAAGVPAHGWTGAAIDEGARSLGLSPVAAGLLPRREASLVEHYARALNAQLARELEAKEEEEEEGGEADAEAAVVGRAALRALPTRAERVARVLRRRLEMQREHLESWPQALAALASAAPQPGGAAAALELLGDVADMAVRAADAAEEEEDEQAAARGAYSSSASSPSAAAWYGQRAAAAAAYASSELYMQTDCSPGFADTWEQMARRLEDAERVGALAGAAGGAVEAGAAAVARLLGLGGGGGFGGRW
jgi:rpsU-divergently transcribed protein